MTISGIVVIDAIILLLIFIKLVSSGQTVVRNKQDWPFTPQASL